MPVFAIMNVSLPTNAVVGSAKVVGRIGHVP